MVKKKSKKKKRKLTNWQKHVKDYMASHPGLSFKEALPKAKRTYKSGASSTRKSSRKSNPKKGKNKRKRKMPKKKNRKKGNNIVQTAFKFIRLGALVGPGVKRGGDIIAAEGMGVRPVAEGLLLYGGYKDGNFSFGNLGEAWLPYLGANLATYGIPKIIGILRRL